jgi:hypothetical protein
MILGAWGFMILNAVGAALVLGPLAVTLFHRRGASARRRPPRVRPRTPPMPPPGNIEVAPASRRAIIEGGLDGPPRDNAAPAKPPALERR